jgi:peptidoglycan-associated lipoprotein
MKSVLRWPGVTVFALCAMIALSSCSKKDVKQDEPLINPSGDTGGAADTGSGNVGSGNVAGDSGDMQTAYFDFDSYKINGSAKSALKADADYLKANPNATVQIEGHCDERGTTEYNLALGERRANAAKTYLIRLGVEKSRLSTISYGKERPADPGHDESAWSKNRRAAFVILSR